MLYISRNTLLNANKDKNSFDALCFAVCIKLNFQNSIVYHRSIRDMKAFFKVGQDKLQRMISNGIKLGYLENANGMLFAKTLKEHKRINMTLCMPYKTYSISNSDTTEFTIKSIEKALKELIIIQHISKGEFVENTRQQLAKANESDSHVSLRQYKKIVKLASRMNLKSESKKVCNCFSMTSLSKVANCSKSKARKLINKLVEKGSIKKKHLLIETNIPKESFNRKEFDKFVGETGMFGYMKSRPFGDYLYMQVSNMYNVVFDKCAYIK